LCRTRACAPSPVSSGSCALCPPVPVDDHVAGFVLHSSLDPGTRQRIEDKVAAAITFHPRRSGTGPADSRFEHWATLRENVDGLDAAGVVLVRLLVGEALADAIEAHLGAVLVALPKRAGGIRPIACGSVLRRLAARAVCLAFASELGVTSGGDGGG